MKAGTFESMLDDGRGQVSSLLLEVGSHFCFFCWTKVVRKHLLDLKICVVHRRKHLFDFKTCGAF